MNSMIFLINSAGIRSSLTEHLSTLSPSTEMNGVVPPCSREASSRQACVHPLTSRRRSTALSLSVVKSTAAPGFLRPYKGTH
jgi:hypothetical protein